jgi:hypothetical protein
LILPWSGDLAQNAGLVVRCEGWDLDRLSDACSDIVNLDVVDLISMLEKVENLGQSKWDWVLPRDLLV